MKYNLIEIFSQAENDNYSVKIDGNGYKSIVLYGVKIIKDNKTDEVVIIDTRNKLYYYQMVCKEDEEVFLRNGWRIGVYNLTTKKYKDKLDLIEKKIQELINERQPKKIINQLKIEREIILNKYTEINNKIKSK